MPQVTIRRRDGTTRSVDTGSFDGDPNALLQDGESIVVPAMFMDAAGFCRGYPVVVDDDAVSVADRKRVEDARAAMIDRVSNRWRGDRKPAQAQVAVADGITPYNAYKLCLSNAWRAR